MNQILLCRPWIGVAAMVTLSTAGIASAAPSYKLEYLKNDGPAVMDTVYGINDSGLMVGRFTKIEPYPNKYSLATLSGQTVTPLPDTPSYINPAVNNAGDVLGSANAGKPVVVWWHDGTREMIPNMVYGKVINTSGQVLGTYKITPLQPVFGMRYDHGTTVKLPPLHPTGEVYVYSMNDQGVVAGMSAVFTDMYHFYPAIWDANGQGHRLGDDTVVGEGEAKAINNHGHVSGCADVIGCFLYDGTNFTRLPDVKTRPVEGVVAINDDDVIVGYSGAGAKRGPVVVRNGESHYLQDMIGKRGEGWTYMVAYDINNAGQIVGRGTQNGKMVNFIASPIAADTATTP